MDWEDFWWGLLVFIIVIAMFFGPTISDFVSKQQYNQCLQSTNQAEMCGPSPYTEDK